MCACFPPATPTGFVGACKGGWTIYTGVPGTCYYIAGVKCIPPYALAFRWRTDPHRICTRRGLCVISVVKKTVRLNFSSNLMVASSVRCFDCACYNMYVGVIHV